MAISAPATGQHADLLTAHATIEPNGFALPHYTDATHMLYVMEGSACAGLVTPFGIPTNVRKIREGDIWVIPRGWTFWIWNTDNAKSLRLFGVSDTKYSKIQPVGARHFHLAGAGSEHMPGATLWGFSKEYLARAWNVDEKLVREVLESQKGSVIVKAKPPMDFAVPEGNQNEENGIFFNYIYNTKYNEPDFMVQRGGRAWKVDRLKLPVLEKESLSMGHPNAMLAPHWLNHHEVLFFTRGMGTVEVAYGNGTAALKTNVKAGDLIVLPAMLPHATCASEKGLNWVFMSRSNMPLATFLAGANSVFVGIPEEVLAAAYNVDKSKLKHFTSAKKEMIFIPPRQKQQQQSFTWADGVEDILDETRDVISRMHYKV
eukprot:jgi/Mesen1/4578/ME000232S03840